MSTFSQHLQGVPHKMIHVCMICRRTFRTELTDYAEDKTSHGLCSDECATTYMRDFLEMTEEEISAEIGG